MQASFESKPKPRFKLTIVSLHNARIGRHVFLVYLPLNDAGKPYMTAQQWSSMCKRAGVADGETVSYG